MIRRRQIVWTPERVRELRRKYRENQADFARRFRVSIQAVQTWEQGKGDPSGPVTVILDTLEAALEESEELAGAK